MLPSFVETASARAPCSGESGSDSASSISFARSALQVSKTADPTLAAVIDPAEMGASGISLSPRSKRTCS